MHMKRRINAKLRLEGSLPTRSSCIPSFLPCVCFFYLMVFLLSRSPFMILWFVSLSHASLWVQITYMLIPDKMDFKQLVSFPLGVRQNVNLTNNVNYLRYVVLILRMVLPSHACCWVQAIYNSMCWF